MLILTRLVLIDTLLHCMLQIIYGQDKSLGAYREAAAEMESYRRWLWSLTSFAISITQEKEEERTEKKEVHHPHRKQEDLHYIN